MTGQPDLLQFFWNKFFQPVREIREELCGGYCPICGDNCCNGRLNPAVGAQKPFTHLKKVRYRWHTPPPEGPYIIDHRFLWMGKCYISGACPYLKDNLCLLYEKSERPWECMEYPLYLQVPFGIPFLRPFISVEKSCNIFKYEKNCEKIEALAYTLGLDVVFHPAPDI